MSTSLNVLRDSPFYSGLFTMHEINKMPPCVRNHPKFWDALDEKNTDDYNRDCNRGYMMVPMDMIIAALVVSCIGCNAAMYIALMYKRLSETYFLMVYACFQRPHHLRADTERNI